MLTCYDAMMPCPFHPQETWRLYLATMTSYNSHCASEALFGDLPCQKLHV